MLRTSIRTRIAMSKIQVKKSKFWNYRIIFICGFRIIKVRAASESKKMAKKGRNDQMFATTTTFISKRKKVKEKQKKLPSLKLSFDLENDQFPVPSSSSYNFKKAQRISTINSHSKHNMINGKL